MQKVLNATSSEAKIISLNGKLSISSRENNMPNKLIISLNEGIRFIDFDDIIRLKSSSNYTEIYTKSGKTVLVSKTLKSILKKMPSNIFLRVHNSHVVNINSIKLLTKDEIHLSDESSVPISRTNRKSVLGQLGIV